MSDRNDYFSDGDDGFVSESTLKNQLGIHTDDETVTDQEERYDMKHKKDRWQKGVVQGYIPEVVKNNCVVKPKQMFRVPETISVMRSLITVRCLSSLAVQLWLTTCFCTLATVYFFENTESSINLSTTFFAVQFIFWRLAYNVGIGLILSYQSNDGSFLKFYKEQVLTRPFWKKLFTDSVVFADPEEKPFSSNFSFNSKNQEVSEFPVEFGAWYCFRFIVNIILANDLLSFLILCWVHLEIPELASLMTLSGFVEWSLRYIIGVSLIAFAVWSKTDAHRIIGDFAWYWGDFFFLLDTNLVFDGVFELFPHPMYSVGYFFMYGFSIITRSYTVFYWSVFAQLCQLIFLAMAENPHIEKTYCAMCEPTEIEKARDKILYGIDYAQKGYFEKGKELVTLKNISLFRASDLILVMLMCYSTFFTFASSAFASNQYDFGILGKLNGHHLFVLAQYMFWRLFLQVGLGYLLRRESQEHWYTKSYFGGDAHAAFASWKNLFNTAVSMANYTLLLCGLIYLPEDWSTLLTGSAESDRYLRIAVGFIMIGLNVYVVQSIYEAIGDYGYFFGDFFPIFSDDSIDESDPMLKKVDVSALQKKQISYTGVYRYMNNPDTSPLGFAGHYGLALICDSWLLFVVALGAHSMAKGFYHMVEKPHMDKLYGPEVLRQKGGLRAAFGNAVSSTSSFRKTLLRKRTQARTEYLNAKEKTRALEAQLRSMIGSPARDQQGKKSKEPKKNK